MANHKRLDAYLTERVTGRISAKAVDAETTRRAEAMTDRVRDGSLQAEFGSRRAAARALGVDEASLRRWEKGANPPASTIEKVRSAVRGEMVTARAAARAERTGSNTVNVKAQYREERGKRGRPAKRDIDQTKLKLAPGTMQRVAAAVAAGQSPSGAFIAGIGDPWYHAAFDAGEGDDDGYGFNILS